MNTVSTFPLFRSKFPSENSLLSPRLLDAHLNEAELGPGKLFTGHPSDLLCDIFCQQLRAGINKGKKDDIPPRQDDSLIFIKNFNTFMILADFEQGAGLLYEGAMIQIVTDSLHQRLKGDEIEQDTDPVQFAFNSNGDLVVVSVQRLSLAIGKDKKMR